MKLKDYTWFFDGLNFYNEEEIYIHTLSKYLKINEIYEQSSSDNEEFLELNIDFDQMRMLEFSNFRLIIHDMWGRLRNDFDQFIESFINEKFDNGLYLHEAEEEYFLNWLISVKYDLEEKRTSYSMTLWSKLVVLFNGLLEIELKNKELNTHISSYKDEKLKSILRPFNYYWNKIIKGYYKVKDQTSYLDYLISQQSTRTDSKSVFIDNVADVTSYMLKPYKDELMMLRNKPSEEKKDLNVDTYIIKVEFEGDELDFTASELGQAWDDYHSFIKLNYTSASYVNRLNLVTSDPKWKPIDEQEKSRLKIRISKQESKQIIFEILKQFVDNVESLKHLLLKNESIEPKINFIGNRTSLGEFFGRLKDNEVIQDSKVYISKWIVQNFQVDGKDLSIYTISDAINGKTKIKEFKKIGLDSFPVIERNLNPNLKKYY